MGGTTVCLDVIKKDCTVPIIEAKNRAYNYAVNSLWIWKERNILLKKLLT